MPTKAQIKANRQNAQNSTGPKTPEGKEAASQNSTKHGLLSHRDVISSESQAEFDLHRDQFLEELNPETTIQSFLADRIVSLSWRLKRAEIIQNQAMDVLDERNDKSPIVKMTQAMLLKLYPVPEDDDDDPPLDIPLGHMAVKDYSNERVLDRLLMYERRIESSLHKTMQEFQRLKLIKKLETEQEMQTDHPTNHSPINSSTHPPIHSINHPPIHSINHPPIHSSTHTPIHSIMPNEPNLQNPKNVTHYPTSNYNKKQRTMNNEQLLKTNPLSSYNFSDKEWESLLTVAKEEKKKLKTSRSRNY